MAEYGEQAVSTSLKPRISGTRFIDADGDLRPHLSLGASHRDQHRLVTGTGGGSGTGAIDTPSHERCVVCAPATERLTEELFQAWNDALQTGDARKVTALYTEDAVLLATVSNVPRVNPAEIQEYFQDFLEKKPFATINSRNVKIGCNKLIDAGTYTFRITDGGKTKDVPARYTFVYENRDGQWRIVHHHSSMMPNAVPCRPLGSA